MKKMLMTATVLLMTAGLFAESVPQPAFRLLDGYLDQRAANAEYGAKVGPWVLMTTGVLSGAAAATVWYGGDAIADGAGVGRMSSESKFGWTLGLALGSVVLTGVGWALHEFPPVFDERSQYSAIYKETDPELQERMAVARLKQMAETGKANRTVGGAVNLGLSAGAIALQILYNQEKGRSWTNGFNDDWSWPIGGVIGGTVSLLVPSPEEALLHEYEYIMARDAQK